MTDKATEFCSLITKLRWIVPLPEPAAEKAFDALLSSGSALGARTSWPDVGDARDFLPERLLLPPAYREELKSAVRKRCKVKGNVDAPFILLRDQKIEFECSVWRFGANAVSLWLETGPIEMPLGVSDLIRLSTLPTDPNNGVRFAVEKLDAFLSSADIFARKVTTPRYCDYFPVVHIMDYQPRDKAVKIDNDVPWHALAALATRHKDIAPENQTILPSYKAKNYSLFNDIAVLDKQSLLLVEDSHRLEYDTYLAAVNRALHVRRLLRHHGDGENIARLGPMLETLQLTYRHPIAMTEHENCRRFWVRALDAFMIPSRIEALESRLRGSEREVQQVVERLSVLHARAGDISEGVEDILKSHEANILGAWVCVRRILENVVHNICDYNGITVGSMKEKNLDNVINQVIRKRALAPDDVLAAMLTLKEYGNIGAHGSKTVYAADKSSLFPCLHALAHLFDWYVNSFLAEHKCPECGARVGRKGAKFCSSCGADVRKQQRVLKCVKCGSELSSEDSFCGECGAAID